MSNNMIYASIAVACFVGLLSVLDILTAFPFAGYSMTVDSIFLISSAIIGYLSWDAYRDNC